MIRLWKGYHSNTLPALIQESWENENLLILCPPLLKDLSFISFLPEGGVQLCGELWGDQKLQSTARDPISYPDNPVLGVFTSGTISGNPRLVLYSKKNIESSLSAILSLFDRSQIESVFCYPQPFHTFGLLLGYVFSQLYGLKLVMGEGRYSSSFHEQWLESATANRLTLGTATHFQDLIRCVESSGRKVSPSYSCIVGGSPVSVSLWKDIQSKLLIHAPSIGYGATEASLGITHQPPGFMPKEDGEIGFPLKSVQIQGDFQNGLEFSGDSVCLAIIQNQKVDFPKKVLIRDKILRREDGVLLYRGRHELNFNRGGEKFSLEEIEQKLGALWSDFEVLAVPIPHVRLGEDLGLLVQSRSEMKTLDLEESRPTLRAFLKEIYGVQFDLAAIRLVSELPLNNSAKVDRKAAAELLRFDLPLSVSRLHEWVPHRPPMVWVDEVTQVSADAGECRVQLSKNALYMGTRGVRPSSMIEWIAQSFAYVRSTQHLLGFLPMAKKPDKVFLVGVRDAKYHYSEEEQLDSDLQPPSSLSIQVSGAKEVGPLILFDGKVFTASGRFLFEAKLKVYSE